MLLSPRRPRQGRKTRRQRRALIESLEGRRLLAGDVPEVIETTSANVAPVVDLNGDDEIGADFHVCFDDNDDDGAGALIADSDATLTDIDGGPIAGAGNGDIITASQKGPVLRVNAQGDSQQIGTLPAGFNARGLAIDDATDDVYVAGESGQIAKVSGGTVTLIATDTDLTGNNLWGIAVENDGNLLVTDQTFENEKLYRIDISTEPATVTTLLDSGLAKPFGLEISDDGLVYIADQGEISVYDPNSQTVSKLTAVNALARAEDVSIDTNGDIIALDSGAAKIYRVDPATGQLDVITSNAITGVPRSIALDSDGQIVTTRNSAGIITVYDSVTGVGTDLLDTGETFTVRGVDIESTGSIGDNIASLTVTISNVLDGSDESLSADVSGTNITASYDVASGTLTLSGDDTAANYQSVLGTVTYNNTADPRNTSDRIITVVANDGSDDSDPAITTIEFNQAPVIETTALDAVENSTDVGIVFASDPGHCEDTLTYSLTGGPDAALLSIDPATGELTFDAEPDFEAPADANGDNVYDVEVTVTDSKGLAVDAIVSVTVADEVNVSGFIFADVDGDGEFDAEDAPIPGAEVTLVEAGVDQIFGTADDESFTAITDDDGFYGFEDVAAGLAQIIETGAPADLDDGLDTPGDAIDLDEINDQFTVAVASADRSELNFAELAKTGELGDADVASIGFWQNRKGQQLLDDLDADGGLKTWLTDTFDNIFDEADFLEYDGDVGEFYRNEFFRKKFKQGPKVDAQFMAVAFSVYATSSYLSGTAALGTRFNVTETGIGTTVVNVGDSGEAFGVEDNSDMLIINLLLATNELTANGADLVYDGAQDSDGDGVVDNTGGDLGTLDSYERWLRELANEVYADITRT